MLNTGDPVLMPWARAVKCILEMWYPGQEGGPRPPTCCSARRTRAENCPSPSRPRDALPDVRPQLHRHLRDRQLPDVPRHRRTQPVPGRRHDQLPHHHRHAGQRDLEGYRWYDEHDVTPLFPFGYGLSYTSFSYSNLSESGTKSADGIDVTFTVTNTGAAKGSETPQVYLGQSPDLPASVQQAVRKLVGFQRVTLAPGASQSITLHITQQQLSSWADAANNWLVGTGTRTIYVGSSSRDPRLQKNFTLKS